LGALSRAEAAWIQAERAGGPDFYPEAHETALQPGFRRTPKAAFLNRRGFIIGGGAIAASVAAAVAVPALLPHEQILKTAAGEIRKFALKDGSLITLDTASEIAVTSRRGKQEAALVNGRAFFTIAPAAAEAFLLRAREIALTASASAFSVSAIEHTPLQVIVTAGRIAVNQANASGRVPLAVLRRGMELSVPVGSAIEPSMIRQLPEQVLSAATQWQSGLLTFSGDTLERAAGMFNRYGGTQIAIPDRSLAAEPITGVFRNSDAAGFAVAIASTLGARTVTTGNTISIVR
jgi:transmembrane sensor